ncbi:hypothetical protein [Pelagicoccus sp. SDUM812005]|uniref:sodium:solute symporter family transporter n=1 Tax=Pelagicoccus sp. SDUM812005 TaxID=3041257 RepID=UPI00280F93E4|nr:hypothetical protein [Pelagicoccus sp. SDUM812005]MDQ8181015.1 hypothetical protein [Pelagicoccus sp. SDUM812005]
MDSSPFTAIDWTLLIAFLLGTTWFGHALRGKGQDVESFFAGGRDLPWWAVSGSLIATSTSALTFVAVPSVVFKPGGDLTFFQISIGFILGNILLAHTLLKAIYNAKYYSPYDFVEDRLGRKVANYTRLLFTIGAVLSQSVRLLSTALILSVVTGLSLQQSILVIGLFAVVWTWMGGITTVVWTDFLQLMIFVCGSLFILANLLFALPGGLTQILEIADDKGKLVILNLTANPTVTYTLWVGIFGTSIFEFAQKSVDQVVTQRLYCCRSLRDAQKALYGACFANVTVWIMLAVGIGLVAFFEVNPLPAEAAAQIASEPDRIVPYYIVNHLPVGVSGLLVASLFAAGISTLDSALSALSQTTTTNLLRTYVYPDRADRFYLKLSKGCVLFWGFALSGIALLFNSTKELGLLDMGLSVPGYVYGSILGIALLAWMRVGDLRAILVGSVAATVSILLLQEYGVSFFWWYPVGAVALIAFALATLRLFPSERPLHK